MNPQFQNRSLLGRQPLYHLTEVVPLFPLFKFSMRCGGGLADRFGHFNELLRVRLHVIDSVIRRDPVEPGLQARFLSKIREVLEGLDEHFLGEIPGIVGV